MLVILLVSSLLGGAGLCSAEETMARTKRVCCGQDPTGILWYGSTPRITFEELARYCGPILWFSPDEPLLDFTPGTEMMIPEPVPFEEPADSPVVYY